jgi:hypothetical protein
MKLKHWILMLAVAVVAGVAGGVAVSQEVTTTTKWVQICYSTNSSGTFTEFDLDTLTSSSTTFAKCASGLKQLTIQAISP